MNYFIILFSFFLSLTCKVQAQARDAKAELKNIAEAYLNEKSLSYQCRYIYSNKINPVDIKEELVGKVSIHGENIWSVIDNIEIIQNNIHNLVIDHDDRLIIINDKQPVEKLLFKIRPDSILNDRTIQSFRLSQDTSGIYFISMEYASHSMWKECIVKYNNETYLITEVVVTIRDVTAIGESNFSGEGSIAISFSDYSFKDPDLKIFDTGRFIASKNGAVTANKEYDQYQVVNNSTFKTGDNHGK